MKRHVDDAVSKVAHLAPQDRGACDDDGDGDDDDDGDDETTSL